MIILADSFIPEIFPDYCRVYIDVVSLPDVRDMFRKREWCSLVSNENIPIFSDKLGIPKEQLKIAENIPKFGDKDYLVIGFVKEENIDWRVIGLL
ncbi:MAG TPA: hypothetical protein GX692_00985 [Acholeplasmataceae bacterium]|nr:hypothetical protein [Acholeplasmataceae bacterium]